MKVVLIVFIEVLLFQFYGLGQFLRWNSNAAPYQLILVDDTVSEVYDFEARFTCMNMGDRAIGFTRDGYAPQYSAYEYSDRIGTDDQGFFSVKIKTNNRLGILDYVGEDVRLKSNEPYMYSFQVKSLVAFAKTERIYENNRLKAVIGYNRNMVKVMAEVDEQGKLVGYGPIDEHREKTGAWAFFRDGVAVGSKIYSQAMRISCFLLDMDSIQQGAPVNLMANRRSLSYYQEPIDRIDSAYVFLSGVKAAAQYSKAGYTGRFDFYLSYKEDSVLIYSLGRKARIYPNRGGYLIAEAPLYFSKNKKEKSMPNGQFDLFYRIIPDTYAILLDYEKTNWKSGAESKDGEAALSKKYAHLGWYEINGMYVVSLGGMNKEKKKQALDSLLSDPWIASVCQGISTPYALELEYLRNEVMFVHKGAFDYEKLKAVAGKYGFERLPTSASLPNESMYKNTSKMTGEDFIKRYIRMSQDPAFQGARMQTMSTRNMLD